MKKGMVYWTFIMSFAFVSLILPLAYVRLMPEERFAERHIGKDQIIVLGTYEKAQKIMFYVDLCAEIGIQGIDEDLEDDEVRTIFLDRFMDCINDHPQDLPIERSEYDIRIRKDSGHLEVIGSYGGTLPLDIVSGDLVHFGHQSFERNLGYYYLRPSFHVPLG